MDVFEAIRKRHSYRGAFEDRPVPREDLRQILDAGLQAPSGVNAQTTTFVIVDDAALLQQVREMAAGKKALQSAQALIACVIDEEPEPTYHGMTFQVEDCAAAVENMLLAITALGYATVWLDGWLRVEGRAEKIGALLKAPSGKRVRVLLPIGVPVKAVTSPAKKSFAERAWFNHYGQAEL